MEEPVSGAGLVLADVMVSTNDWEKQVQFIFKAGPSFIPGSTADNVYTCLERIASFGFYPQQRHPSLIYISSFLVVG